MKNNNTSSHSSKNTLFDNKTILVVFSIVLAIVAWFIVSFQLNTARTRTIKNVKVALGQNSSAYQSLGLDIIDRFDRFVDITVTGDVKVIGTLDASAFLVVPNYSSVKEAGNYNLPLTVTKNNPLQNFEITSVSPSTVELRFDNAISRKFTVNLEIIGHSAADGYMIDTIVSSPAEITVTGPENEVASVSRVVATYRVDDELSESLRVTCPIRLLDASGNELTSTALRVDVNEVDVTIPVYKQGTLDLDIGFSNVPDGFDVTTIEYVLSRSSIDVAGVEKVIDNMTTKIVGYVDLAQFKLGGSYTFELNLQSGVVNLDNVETVTVTFPKTDLNSKRINVSDIRVENAPANYSITVTTRAIYDVTVIGPPSDVESLLAGSVIAIVDVNDISVESGTYNVPVTFRVTANNTTWVAGSYTVTIEVEPK